MRQNSLQIAAVGLACATGSNSAGLLSAMLTQTYAPNYQQWFSDSKTKFYAAPVNHLEKIPFEQRINFILAQAIQSLLQNLPKGYSQKPMRWHLVLPPTNSLRAPYLQPKKLQAQIKHFMQAEINLTFSTADNNILHALIKELEQPIIFGSVDSLIEANTCAELQTNNLLVTQTQDYGIIPGEAAAFVLLQAPSNKNNQTVISEISSDFITQYSIDAIITASDNTPTDPIAHYNFLENHWPKNSTEHSPETWHLQKTLGEIGAATLPTQLVLATERLRYPFPNLQQTAICDSTQNFSNKILLLKKTSSN